MDSSNQQPRPGPAVIQQDCLYISRLDDRLPETLEDSIISRTLLKADGLRVVLFGFAQGQELTSHTSGHPALLHLLEGRAFLTLGEQELDAEAGAWIFMPAGLPHAIRAQTELKMLLYLFPPKTSRSKEEA